MEPVTLRKAVRDLVGWPEAPTTTRHLSRSVIQTGDHRCEELLLDAETPIPATLILPKGPGPHPAVIYCHGHGGDYDLGRKELTQGARWLEAPVGPALADAGFAVLAIDAIGFGDRRAEGAESARAKALIWQGRSLFARMVQDLHAALGYLADRPEIDRGRLFSFGVSMGAAQAYWLAALDTRLAGCAHGMMLADIAGLCTDDTHDRHGLYLLVPGLLRLCDQGDVAGLIAPRPQCVLHGADDSLTPDPARQSALARLTRAYAAAPDRLDTHLAPGVAHHLTHTLRDTAIRFLARHAALYERIPS